MKAYLKQLGAILTAGILTLAISGCGGGDSSAPAGPAAASAFAGTSISFNPTVNFLTASTLTYFNDEAGTPFPAANPAINGTYTYTPNATFTAGTLTLTLDGVGSPLVLEISNFRRSGANVTGFTARSGGQSYPVSVTGSLAAYQPPADGGGGSGESRAPDIPAGMQGTYELTFHISDTSPITGVPADGTVTTFTIGARTLSFDGRTLTNPIHYNDNPFEWIFKDGNIWWAVSEAVNGGLNEINVQGPYSAPSIAFYGQYNDRDGSGGGDGGYNSLGIGQNGGYVGGGFNATVTGVTGPDTLPDGAHLAVQELTMGQTINISFSNNGDLLSPDLFGVFNFSNSNAASSTYLQIRPTDTPAVSDTITIAKDGNELPVSLTIYSVRTGTRTTQVTYTLDVEIPR